MLKKPQFTPINFTLFYLCTLALLAVLVKFDPEYYLMRIIGFVALAGGFLLIPAIKHRKGALQYPFLSNNLITIVILFLILDEFIAWWQFMAFGFIASALKHFLRVNRLPLFNPAAAGVVVAVALGALETWWGVSFAPRMTPLEMSMAVLLTVPAGLYLAQKYKKWAVALSFLAAYGIFMTIWLQELPLYQLLEGTMLFFAFIMVSEPKTSPNLVPQQILFGGGVGLLAVIFIIQGVASPYVSALILGNLLFRLYMWWQQKRRMKATQSQVSTPVTPTPTLPTV